MVATRITLKELRTDEDLLADSKEKDFIRKQKVLDAFNNLTVKLIYVIPFIIGVLGIIVILGHVYNFDVKIVETWLYSIISAFIGYLTAYLQRSGLEKNN